MTAFAGAAFVIVGFLVLMALFGLVERSLRVVAVSKQATRDLTDSSLDDDAKESAMRVHAKTLGGLFVLLTAGAAAAVGAPLGVIAILDAAAVLSFASVMEALLSWWMIAAAVVLTGAVSVFGKRRSDGEQDHEVADVLPGRQRGINAKSDPSRHLDGVPQWRRSSDRLLDVVG